MVDAVENVISRIHSQPMSRPRVEVCAKEGFLQLNLQEVWNYRELLYYLVWREVKVRYKQTAIGIAWVLLQPLLTMAIFTIIFGYFAKLPSDGLPYSIFAYAALLPWTYFSEAVTRSGQSLVGDANLLRKVYFPRLIIPLAAILAPLVDFCLSFLMFLCLLGYYGIVPTWNILALPFLLLIALLTALAMGLWLAALNVRYRDVRHAIPFLIQFLMYASPVAYAVSVVPERWRAIYSINPMVGVIEGFRWGLLGKANPDFYAMAISSMGVLVVLISGLFFFRQVERTFADVV